MGQFLHNGPLGKQCFWWRFHTLFDSSKKRNTSEIKKLIYETESWNADAWHCKIIFVYSQNHIKCSQPLCSLRGLQDQNSMSHNFFLYLKLYYFCFTEIFVGSTGSELQHPWISKITMEPKKSQKNGFSGLILKYL